MALVQTAALMAIHGVLDNQVADIDHITQFADFRNQNGFLIEIFRFPVQNLQTVESALQTDVGADNAHIIAHDGLQLFARLGNQYHLLIKHSAFGVPFDYLHS